MIWLLWRVCICLALVKWASMPLWGAVLLLYFMQMNILITTIGTYLIGWTASESVRRESAQQDQPASPASLSDEDINRFLEDR